MAHKEFELTHAVLRYASACIRDGDWPALRDIGFSEREVEALRELTLSDLTLLERRLDGHILRVRLDRTAYWMVMEQVQREVEIGRIKREMIGRNAPADMMQALFGMGSKEYASTRRALRAPRGVGRPAEPDEDTSRAVWLVWEKLVGTSGRPRLRQWLMVADGTGACLRTIWRLAQRWLDERPPSESSEIVSVGHASRRAVIHD